MNNCNLKSNEKCLDCKKCIIMKYVRFDFTDFVFLPLHIPHNNIFLKSGKEPISAGFLNITKMEVFGKSESLNLNRKKDDITMISLFLEEKCQK